MYWMKERVVSSYVWKTVQCGYVVPEAYQPENYQSNELRNNASNTVAGRGTEQRAEQVYLIRM